MAVYEKQKRILIEYKEHPHEVYNQILDDSESLLESLLYKGRICGGEKNRWTFVKIGEL